MPNKRIKKRIHINQLRIRANIKRSADEQEPVITIQRNGKSPVYGFTIEIDGPSRVINRPHKPLGCGARVWIETQADVFVDGELLE